MDEGLTIRILLAAAMLGGLAWLAQALKRKRLGGNARGPGLAVRDRVALSDKQALHLVTLPDGRWVVIASSAAGCRAVAESRSGAGRAKRPTAKARGAAAR